MWLPKEQRKVLCYLYKNLGKEVFSGRVGLKSQEFIKCCFVKDEFVDIVRLLDNIGLLRLQNVNFPKDYIELGFTPKGYDLGRKYSSWWTRSGEWFAEYKNHWFWLIVSFLGGTIGALIVNWLSKGD